METAESIKKEDAEEVYGVLDRILYQLYSGRACKPQAGMDCALCAG